MTSPAPVTTAYPIPVGGAGVRITDGANNAPAGLQLVNRGDNGGTVWVMAGPAGQAAAVPLGPGASIQWTDTGNLPYAYLSTAATKPETLVVTGQAQAYNNPTTVAAALIQQGIPSTFLDTGYGTWRLGWGQSSSAVTVGQSSSLIVSVQWPQIPTGCTVLQVAFTDPAVPDLSPINYYLTQNNSIAAEQSTWVIPVAGPAVTLTNLTTPDNNQSNAYVQMVGNNRPVDRLRQLGDEGEGRYLYAHCPTVNTTYPCVAYPTGAGESPFTRMNGPINVNLSLAGAGSLYFFYVNPKGTPIGVKRDVPSGNTSFTMAHPRMPVYWQFTPTSVATDLFMAVTDMS